MSTAADRFAAEGFGPENLPYASFSPTGGDPRLGVRLGDRAIDVAALAATVEGLDDAARTAVSAPNLDALLAAGHGIWTALRAWLVEVVTADGLADTVEQASHPVDGIALHMPFTVADYVDYYASEHHASNVGRMFRPDQAPLLPNWKHLPVGYHGRAGTVIPSGKDFPRPKGLRPEQDGPPSFGPSRRLDIEAELGFVLGGAAPAGEVSLEQAAAEHLFGVVLFNDWSARDIQAYEYVPLGPYLGKSFASSISLWVVPWQALSAARVAPPAREHELAPYLDDEGKEPWGLDITLGVSVDGRTVSHPPASTLYWTAPQMVAHMSVNGASLRPGDFFGSGTVSGPEKDQRGSFLELSWGGKEPFALPGGTEMTFLADGQSVTLTGTAPGPGGSVIDLGECTATILPAT
ncbi:2-keto-4-pentenoate hydratase/2-oxohepta-3-ene-1,7-dioic acid hydratase (catechol pathway) [Kocuria rosea]|uniref:fumarylacetoacetase n=1 Tax=Kocuria rosea TaxID=1275 RepID=UPI000F6BC7F0|nr:fumarylacetoacetase [Kocuria rosea]VEH44227.1 2-keto-4-pentenoate hydratase/2-oxohepta-3-ene-1,7-dioic acid hydratase (catechol pathway) [Kocuria rosea]